MSELGLSKARELSASLKSDVEIRVIQALGDLRDDDLGFTPVSYKALARTAKCSEKNVVQYVRRLERAGLILRKILLGPTKQPLGNAFFLTGCDQLWSANPRWQVDTVLFRVVDEFDFPTGLTIQQLQVRLSGGWPTHQYEQGTQD